MPYITTYAYRPLVPSRKQRFSRLSVALLMFVSLVVLVLPFVPKLSYTVQANLPGGMIQPNQVQAMTESDQSPGDGNWLLIPAIGVKAAIVEGEDVGVLDREEGVWHQTGTIGQGNFVIAGHRFKYLPPNRTTLYALDRLKSGDTIIIWEEGQRHAYVMSQQSTVGNQATEILNPTPEERLTIYTCTDLAASKRLVIVAKPV